MLVVAGAAAGFSPAAGRDLGAGWAVGWAVGWVVGCGAASGGCCCPGAASGAGSVDDTGTGVTGDAGCGRESAAVFAALLAGPPSDASLAGRWVFCPTTYPMANATANSS